MSEGDIGELSTRVEVLSALYENYIAWAAVIVAVLTLAVVFGSLLSISYFRRLAKVHAQKSAAEIAEAVAEREANLYIQEEMPSLISQYMEMAKREAGEDESENVSRHPGD